MSFEKNHYIIIKEAISKELALFVYLYFLNKRRVTRRMFDDRYISPFATEFGVWSDKQIPNTYAHYSDIAMETLLENLRPELEQQTGLELIETYSYARIYKKGDVLERHKDRPSCEISGTLNLGGDEWPIFIESSGEEGKEGSKVILEPGDMLIYRGCELEHWREAFEGENCSQVFFHYNDVSGENSTKNRYDGRPFLGLPQWYANR